jgi:hypothetical protein
MEGFVGRWVSQDEKYRAVIEKLVWQKMLRRCVEADSEETGGILIGFYSEDLTTAVVTDATAPPTDSNWGSTWFCRGIAGLRKLLADLWTNPRRLYYLGEWHYHPVAALSLSEKDIDEMKQISKSSRYRCSEPILVVVGRATTAGQPPCRVFVFPAGAMCELYEKELQPVRRRRCERASS